MPVLESKQSLDFLNAHALTGRVPLSRRCSRGLSSTAGVAEHVQTLSSILEAKSSDGKEPIAMILKKSLIRVSCSMFYRLLFLPSR